MKKIILDTNFLIDCFRFKIDFLEELKDLVQGPFEILILSCVVKELKKISKKKSKESKYAKFALKLIKRRKFKILETSSKNADKEIIANADKNTIVATNDAKLRKSLKVLKIKNIYLRARKHLDIS